MNFHLTLDSNSLRSLFTTIVDCTKKTRSIFKIFFREISFKDDQFKQWNYLSRFIQIFKNKSAIRFVFVRSSIFLSPCLEDGTSLDERGISASEILNKLSPSKNYSTSISFFEKFGISLVQTELPSSINFVDPFQQNWVTLFQKRKENQTITAHIFDLSMED